MVPDTITPDTITPNPTKLMQCVDRGVSALTVDTTRELTKIAEKMARLDEARRRLIDGYATGRTTTKKYVEKNRMFDSQLKRLMHQRTELISAAYEQSGSADKDIRQFCANARAQFEECTDDEAKRLFLCKYIEKIIFTHDHVAIFGSITAQRASKDIELTFRIEGEIDRKEARAKAWEKRRLNVCDNRYSPSRIKSELQRH